MILTQLIGISANKNTSDPTLMCLIALSQLFGSIDHQLFAKMCFVAIRSLRRAEKTFQYKISRSITIATQREGKKRTVAHTEVASCS